MNESITNNILEDVFVKTFSPFHKLQFIIGSNRVNIKSRLVLTPTILQKLYTIIFITVTTTLYINMLSIYQMRFKNNYSVYLVCLCYFFIYYMTYLFTIIHARFVYNENNHKFILRMQALDRMMTIHKNLDLYKPLYNSNLKSVLFYLIISTVTYTLTLYRNIFEGLIFFGIFYSSICCGLEWLHISNIVMYLYTRLQFTNAIMINHLESELNTISQTNLHMNVTSKKYMRFYASKTRDFKIDCTDKYLKDLLHIFNNFQDLYRFEVCKPKCIT